MFNVHFHFEESYAAWVQAITSIVGIYFLVRAYQQSNKSHELQITALRNTTRPEIRLVDPKLKEQKAEAMHTFCLEITKRPAMRLFIKMTVLDLFNYQNEYSYDVKGLIYYDQVEAGTRIVFHVYFDFDQYSIYFPNAQSVSASSDITLNYYDENGYQYEQSMRFQIIVSTIHSPTLSRVRYL